MSIYGNEILSAQNLKALYELALVDVSYTKIEYIESNGYQWIDTQFTPDSDTSVILDAELTTLTSVDPVGWSAFYSTRGDVDGSFNKEYALWKTNDLKYRLNFDVDNDQHFGEVDTERHTFYQNKNVLYIDNVLAHSESFLKFSALKPLYLCASNGPNGIVEYPGSMRVYSFKIYDGDILVRNYIPVIRKTDNLVGLFDLTTKTFYENSGTQPFIAGPAI